jgi:hypothetical protein
MHWGKIQRQRKGAGRPKRVGWKQTSVSMPLSTWKGVKRLAARRRKTGEKGVSAARLAGEILTNTLESTELVYFDLEPQKRLELERVAKERGCTVDELVRKAVAEFVAERRSKLSKERRPDAP